MVESKPGGGGKLAVAAVTGARPDGHTLLFATPTFTLATAKRLATYDFVKDFEPTALMGVIAYTLVVSPGYSAYPHCGIRRSIPRCWCRPRRRV